jgi:dimethylamine/trimethylamine dehydrogenase
VLTEIHLDGVALGGSDGRTASITSVEAECVVLVTQRQSDDELYRELKRNREALAREGVVGVYRIGDCVAPRLITDCVFDGHRLAREIDSSDPAVPLPYIREHRIMGASDEYYDAILGNGPAIA